MNDDNKLLTKDRLSTKEQDSVQREETPGRLLKAAREQQGKDEKSVADALKISSQRLKAIEADDFSGFSSGTYIRGHLKNYGRLLGIDETVLLSAYEQQLAAEDKPALQDGKTASTTGNTHKQWWYSYLVLVLLVLLWILSWWFLNDTGRQQDSDISQPEINTTIDPETNAGQPSEQPDQETQTSTDTPPTAATGKNSPEADTIVVSKLTAAEVVNQVIPEEQKAQQEQAITSLVSSSDELLFSFENLCWIKVSDANDEVIFAGLQQPGTDLTLLGKGPFTVVIGNVDGTSLAYNGEPVQLSARGNSKLVHLQVGG